MQHINIFLFLFQKFNIFSLIQLEKKEKKCNSDNPIITKIVCVIICPQNFIFKVIGLFIMVR